MPRPLVSPSAVPTAKRLIERIARGDRGRDEIVEACRLWHRAEMTKPVAELTEVGRELMQRIAAHAAATAKDDAYCIDRAWAIIDAILAQPAASDDDPAQARNVRIIRQLLIRAGIAKASGPS